ncbi:hypothetical protein Tco_0489257 [Tanacetum coccineum]
MPLRKPEPPDLVVVQSYSGTDYHHPMSQLSDISGSACPGYPLSQHRYHTCPAPGLHNFLLEGSSNGGDEVGTDMGKGGGIPDDGLQYESGGGERGGARDNTGEGGDSGSDGDGIGGSGEEGIWGSGKDHGESGDDGGVDIARSLTTSASDHTGVGTGAGIEILAICNIREFSDVLNDDFNL